MQPLQEGCASTHLTLQAPVPTHEFDKLAALTDIDFVNVLEDAGQDERRHDRRPRLVRLSIRAGRLA
jgi:hypothetical protein